MTLARLVDRPVQIDPSSGHLGIRLIDEPPIAGSVPAGLCCVDQQWSEPLHPPEHTHVIHLDATLNQQFFHVSVGEPVAQVPANRDRDQIRREAEPREAGPR